MRLSGNRIISYTEMTRIDRDTASRLRTGAGAGTSLHLARRSRPRNARRRPSVDGRRNQHHPMPKRLYHFTALGESNLGSILREGMIRTTESNVSLQRHREHAGPDVVWLTTNGASAAHVGWAAGPVSDSNPPKTWARLAVDVADAVPWRAFASQHRMKRCDIEALRRGREPRQLVRGPSTDPPRGMGRVEDRASGALSADPQARSAGEAEGYPAWVRNLMLDPELGNYVPRRGLSTDARTVAKGLVIEPSNLAQHRGGGRGIDSTR